ncbi:MAG: DUF1932 domain-containing protein [Pseudolysinimonas sp.]|uniref:NAD(P)-dependent oxidoreductase n=1 Tax=Pseudolysinimonas sp. TaxID=2680009 RepID=UPI003266232C
MRVAVLGLGEAGRLYVEGFSSLGVDVVGYDPQSPEPLLTGLRVGTVADAVRNADFVVSLTGAEASRAVLDAALPAISASTVYADLNTARPEHKAGLAQQAANHATAFADVAVMAPVPRAGVLTPLLASGTGAERVAAEWSVLGIPIRDVGEVAGHAAGLKLLRSVFMKGLAALVYEGVTAASHLGERDWMTAEIASELGPEGAALVDRLLDGTRLHARRRAHEMHDVISYLGDLNAPHWMSDATVQWLEALAEDPGFADSP